MSFCNKSETTIFLIRKLMKIILEATIEISLEKTNIYLSTTPMKTVKISTQ